MALRLPRNPVVLDWLPVAVLPPVLIVDGVLGADGPPVSVWGVLAAVVACLPLVLRRRLGFALLAPLLTAGILLVLWRLEPGNTVVLIPMVALVELAYRGDRRRSVWTGLAVIPCVLVSAVPFGDNAADFAQIVVRNVLLCLLALGVGDWLRTRQESVRQLLVARDEEARRRVGDERLRIAREVHDVVAHAMVAINVQAGVAAHLIDENTDQARDALLQIKRASGEALTDLRATLGLLRDPEQAAPVGPAAGLQDLEALAGGLRSAGVDVRLDVEALGPVPAPVQAAGYRIVQEALTNVLRHAQASEARVVVRRDVEAIRLEVVDDGVAGSSAGGAGHGVRGMGERAATVGGSVNAGPLPDGGWAVRARLPVAAPTAASAP